MTKTIIVGLGATVTAVSSFASEMYFAKKANANCKCPNHNYRNPVSR